jgi:hypothetical protein
LHVSQRSRYEHGILRARLVKGALERRHQLIDQRRRRRYEVRVPRPGPADPVLRSSDSPGCFSLPRPRARSFSCISRMRRFESGKPSRSLAIPCSSAAISKSTV